MDGLAELLLTVTLAIGPNGYHVHAQLSEPELLEAAPIATLRDLTPEIWVVYHRFEGLGMAFYTPPGETLAVPPELAGLAESAAPRLLPALEVPRLFLYEPYYRPRAGAAPVVGMPLDVAEYYFHALLDAWLDPATGRVDPAYRAFIKERADVLFTATPEVYRQEAYRSAVADFGAHLLATALEIERSLDRRRRAGKDPCRVIDHPATLFGMWPRIFAEHDFIGQYYLPAESAPGAPAAPGSWVHTRGKLGRPDKERLVREALGNRWLGDVRHDFGLSCPQTLRDRPPPGHGRRSTRLDGARANRHGVGW